MITGAVVERVAVVQVVAESGDETPVAVLAEENPEARYERLVALVMQMSAWLTGPQAALLTDGAWEVAFSRYQATLAQLRRVGDALRPVTLRSRREPLTGDALAEEVRELFAA